MPVAELLSEPYLDERWIAREMLRYLGEAVLEQPRSARDRVRGLAAVLAAQYAAGDES